MLEINLHNLTRQHLAECKPHLGKCTYAAPCIIGTLIPEDQRHEFDRRNGSIVESLVCERLIDIPEDQFCDAAAMQSAFDREDWPGVLAIANKYIKGAEL